MSEANVHAEVTCCLFSDDEVEREKFVEWVAEHAMGWSQDVSVFGSVNEPDEG